MDLLLRSQHTVLILICLNCALNSFTFSLHIPNCHHLPTVRAMQGDYENRWKFSPVTLVLNALRHEAIPKYIHTNQSQKDDASEIEAISHTNNPTTTKLGLPFNSLVVLASHHVNRPPRQGLVTSWETELISWMPGSRGSCTQCSVKTRSDGGSKGFVLLIVLEQHHTTCLLLIWKYLRTKSIWKNIKLLFERYRGTI